MLVSFQKIKNLSVTLKRNQLGASSVPEAEKESLPGTLSFIPKQGCKENPGVLLRGSGLPQKESLFSVSCMVSADAAAGELGSPDAASETTDSGRNPPVRAPYTVEAYYPSLQHAPGRSTAMEQAIEERSLGLPSCQFSYRLSERLYLKEI